MLATTCGCAIPTWPPGLWCAAVCRKRLNVGITGVMLTVASIPAQCDSYGYTWELALPFSI
jgi:hypothetical protein